MSEAVHDKYRMIRVSDGEGGFDETFPTATNLWGTVVVDEDETKLLVDANEDVLIGDIIGIKGVGVA